MKISDLKYLAITAAISMLILSCSAREKTNVLGAVVVSPSSELASAIGNMATGLKITRTCATSAKQSPSFFRSPAFVPGLGDADATDGHYTVTAGGGTGEKPSGTGKLWFLTDFNADHTDKSKVLNMVLPPSANNMSVYAAKDLNSTASPLTNPTALLGTSQYLPNMWRLASNGQPTSTGWLTLDFTTGPNISNTMSNISTTLTTFFNSWSSAGGPQGIYVEYDAVDQFGFQIHQGEMMDMRSGPPTNSSPATVIGSGYMITPKGKLTTALNAVIGDLGPISGTMTLTSYTGDVGTMTINADGTIDGVIKNSEGVQLGIVRLATDGSGTYTDDKGVHNILN